VYGTVSWGYKSGAFQAQTTSAAAAATPLDPENVINYEVGIKNEFFDNRFRINADVFYMDYTDLQVFRLVGSLLVGANADATSKGFELDTEALLTENWIVGAGYGYLDATYDTFVSPPNDFTGNYLPRSPKNTWTVNSTYTLNLANGSALDFSVVYSGQSKFYFEPSNQASSEEDGYGLLDASITWRSADNRWNISAWGRNLTDEEFRIHSITSNIAGTVDLWNVPLTYGVTAMVSF